MLKMLKFMFWFCIYVNYVYICSVIKNKQIMKLKTFENRTKIVLKNTKGYRLAKELLASKDRVCTAVSSGSGRFTSINDYTDCAVRVLKLAGLKENKDFIIDNNSPRGGRLGNYIELTSNGKRKCINN